MFVDFGILDDESLSLIFLTVVDRCIADYTRFIDFDIYSLSFFDIWDFYMIFYIRLSEVFLMGGVCCTCFNNVESYFLI